MHAATTIDQIRHTLTLAKVGDVLTVTAGKKTRSVTVTSINGANIYTTSGKVRPGNISGGYINISRLDFSPTILQQTHPIESISRSAVVGFGSQSA